MYFLIPKCLGWLGISRREETEMISKVTQFLRFVNICLEVYPIIYIQKFLNDDWWTAFFIVGNLNSLILYLTLPGHLELEKNNFFIIHGNSNPVDRISPPSLFLSLSIYLYAYIHISNLMLYNMDYIHFCKI